MSRIEHAGSAPHAAPALAADAPADATRVLMRWLVGLRWAVFAVLGAALPFEEAYLGYHVRYAVALPVLGAVVLVNAAQHRRIAGGAGSSRAVGLGVAFDLLAIGALLAASGGAANPFSVVFVVHVALAASMLPARTTFALAALAACLFGALFALPSGACCPNHPANGAFSTHLYGMWLAFVVAAGLVSYFLTRVRRALAEREREIAELRRRAEETARFAALGTLAAGTAHELGTPLGTIGVLAGEIADGAEPAARGAHAISVQVARCRDILARLAAGAEAARPRATAPLGETVRRAVAAWTRAHPEAEVEVDAGAPETAPAPLAAEDVEAALCVLLDNALQATSGGEVITVATRAEAGAVELAVEDRGAGVPSELRDRLGEPFVTTKEPGQGMGLGLYWIRTLLARCGGRLLVEPREPRGTRVVLRFAETTPR